MNIIDDSYIIREMQPNEIELAIDWAASEGWNPGSRDHICYTKLDPHGFFVGELNGVRIATVSAVKYGDDYGFVGLYIVEKEFRNHGYGIKIGLHALEYLKGRSMGLDGVVEQQESYKRAGFEYAYRSFRYGGVVTPRKIINTNIVDLASLNFNIIDEYDRSVYLYNRSEFLGCWIKQPQGAAVGYVIADKLRGYAVLRPCPVGYKIGPLFADDPQIAEELFIELVSRANGKEILYDPPDANPSAVQLAVKYGLKPVFETARMYRGDPPNFPLNKIFSITSFEVE